MKVLFCSSEVVPFAKTGGLADVAGALPLALEKLGVKLAVSLPRYKIVAEKGARVKIGRHVDVFLVENDGFYDRDGLYGDRNGDYPDNLARFAFYCRRTLEMLKESDFRPDVIHCHDWQSALIPLYLKSIHKNDPFYQGIKTVFTVHNLGYQGTAPREQYPVIGVGDEFFTMQTLEFYGKVNPMKAGLVFADALTTVSPTYSREIQTPEFGCGLEGVLGERKNDLTGILNGIDYDEWDPASDQALAAPYNKRNPAGKARDKAALQKETGLEINEGVPLLGIITRLADQKGLDLLAGIVDELLKMKIQLILLGTGDEKYHVLFEKLAKKNPQLLSCNLKFDAGLARRIYAGGDFFLMPSRYEPCGLGQMISLRYGTIPIVRLTGGLADTVSEYRPGGAGGNGFCFQEYDRRAFLAAIQRGLAVYRDKKNWQKLVKRALESDFSWNRSARQYLDLYLKLKG